MEDVRRDGPIRERSRLQLDREPSLSRERERGPDGSPVNRGRGALCGSGTEKGIGPGTTWLIVAVSVIFVLIAASISPLGRVVGERRRTRVGARPWLRTTETWLSKDVDETRPSSGVVGRDIVGEDV